jgi:hypothetical protein
MKKIILTKKQTIGLSVGGLALAVALAGAAYAAQADRSVTRAEAQAHAAQMFTRLDVNHDGKLDPADRTARRAAAFAQIDANKDGQISPAEFSAGRPAAPAGMGPDGMGRHGGDHAGMGRDGGGRHGGMGHRMGGGGMGAMMLTMADANTDGAISQAEFTDATLQHFNMADSNKDGTLTSTERRAAHEAMRARMQAAPAAPKPAAPAAN